MAQRYCSVAISLTGARRSPSYQRRSLLLGVARNRGNESGRRPQRRILPGPAA